MKWLFAVRTVTSMPSHTDDSMTPRGPAPNGFPPNEGFKTGWPWNTAPVPTVLKEDVLRLPRITVITPSFNQGGFIEETIRSILLQGYPNLQYIIIDGGSTDATMDVIEKYRPWIDLVVSERDRGQADAILKGLSHATGELFNWINSDDLLAPGTLWEVGSGFGSADLFAGTVTNFGTDYTPHDTPNRALTASNLALFDNHVSYHQPGCWLRCAPFKTEPLLDTKLHYAFDYDLMIRYLSDHPKVKYCDKTLAYFRIHSNSKTGGGNRRFETERRIVWRRELQVSMDQKYSRRIAQQIRRSLDTERWQRIIARVSSLRKGRLSLTAMLAAGVLRQPGLRISRFSFGAIRRVLLK